ncbi:molybdate transport system regulatory protein [Novosphingobium sp. CF614]|uniref:TOBE domain-containing protein n=1 Tax=Novosphingobium sp. CF614 TaxID=1884364 RepID=UPI0008DF6D9C|nr:TOBE domain-containing protein [Novosphingobium sp. CF614]SFG43645.1 molybdate transport system regulatory protein [Novosphingobium sp. CF614]
MTVASLARLNPPHGRLLRTSSRNMLDGIVTAIVHGPVNAEIGLLVNDTIVIDALVSNSSVASLGLEPGGHAVALIKGSFITLLDDVPGLRLSARNLIGGRVIECIDGDVECEVVLDIGGSRELSSIVTMHSARELGLQPGREILASFKASHVILAARD